MRYYTKDHEWIEKDGDTAKVGITSYAAGQLGDVVYVELPNIGKALIGGKEAAVVESVKAASDVYAPVAGFVVERNETLVADPSLVNKDAFGQGWFFKMDPADDADWGGLMDEAAYAHYTKG